MTVCDFDCWERGRDCDHGDDGYGQAEWSGYCYPGCPDDVCRAEGCCAWQPRDEPVLRPVRTIETTGDVL